MDPGPVGEPKKINRRPPPSEAETDVVIKSEFKDGENATFFTKDQLEAIAYGPLGDKPLGLFTKSVQEALKLLKAKKK